MGNVGCHLHWIETLLDNLKNTHLSISVKIYPEVTGMWFSEMKEEYLLYMYKPLCKILRKN